MRTRKPIETWKDVQGYEGIYQVSSHGRVRSLDMVVSATRREHNTKFAYFKDGRILKPRTDRGYHRVTLSRNGKRKSEYIHRLVAMTFVSGYFKGAEVNHINEVRNDNRPDNLEWVTSRQNINHGGHNRRMAATKGRKVVQYDRHGKRVKSYISIAAASRATGIRRENIGKVCNHVKGFVSAGSYYWEFMGNPLVMRHRSYRVKNR